MLSITHGTMDLHAKRKARESTSCCPTTYLCTYLSYLCVLTYLLTLDPVRYICITSPVLCSEPVTAVTCRITHLSCSSCKSKPVLFFACGFAGSYEVITRASELWTPPVYPRLVGFLYVDRYLEYWHKSDYITIITL